MRRAVPAKRVGSVSRDELKRAITCEVLACRAGVNLAGISNVNTANYREC